MCLLCSIFLSVNRGGHTHAMFGNDKHELKCASLPQQKKQDVKTSLFFFQTDKSLDVASNNRALSLTFKAANLAVYVLASATIAACAA
mmetsp:Transcript_37202/g.43281  ORF Transcript_37202/g.43281 Transcript_37202/m.43281 type:complete len:88 (+) Transcript_37202:228-491(+)